MIALLLRNCFLLIWSSLVYVVSLLVNFMVGNDCHYKRPKAKKRQNAFNASKRSSNSMLFYETPCDAVEMLD